ncbi:MAG: HD domain-containing phosphohydrolase [Pseudomonadota bacterium]
MDADAENDQQTLQHDHYVERLAHVNQQNDVLATEDIVNARGTLIARKGTRIDAATARRVALHRLSKPLELQVEISDTLHGKNILQTLDGLVAEHGDLQAVDARLKFRTDFAELLSRQTLNAVLRQKLMVMALRHPALFKQTLLGAWLAALIARELGLPEATLHRAAMAALARDLGLLHLPADLLEKQGVYSPPEWRAMQSHVVISQMIIREVAGMHPDIALAVLEHHERLDGTGYPAGKEGAELGLLGQILSMADALCAIRFKRFSASGHNLGDMEAFLLMNSACYHRAVVDAVYAILRKSDLTRTAINPCGDQSGLLEHLVRRAKLMQQALPSLSRLALMQALESAAQGKELIKRILQTHNIVTRSGIINPEIIQWLEEMAHNPQPGEIPFLCEMELLQNELIWHLNRVRHLLEAFSYEGAELAAPLRRELSGLLDILGNLHIYPAQDTLRRADPVSAPEAAPPVMLQ